LLLGIVTAFTIESFKWLQEDPTQSGADLLKKVVVLLNNTSTQGTIPPPTPFTPDNHQIVVNQLWFLSMILSLSAVMIGTLCLQWLSAYRRSDAKYTSSPDALAHRQVRFEGLLAWGVPFVPALLIMAVQIALVLFSIGLLYLLWNLNQRAAIPALAAAVISAFAITSTLLLPLFLPKSSRFPLLPWEFLFRVWAILYHFPRTRSKALPLLLWIYKRFPPHVRNWHEYIRQCPFKSPWTRIFHFSYITLTFLFSFPLTLFGSWSGWRQEHVRLLKDFRWDWYDVLWRHWREGRPSPRANPISYYLLHGLTSVLETVESQKTTSHIIFTGLQEFYGQLMEFQGAEVDTLTGLLGVDFTKAEVVLLLGIGPSYKGAKASFIATLRRDFINTLILQYLARPNLALRRSLLPMQVELYIRIKNSHVAGKDALVDILWHTEGKSYSAIEVEEDGVIGASLECPIRTPRDAKALTLGEKYSSAELLSVLTDC
jgi:hypothetical protein